MLISVHRSIQFSSSFFLFSDVSQVTHFLGHVAVDRSSWILCLPLLCVRCTFLFRVCIACGAGLLGKSCYSQVVRRNCCLCPVLRGAVSHVAVSSRASGQASGATFVLCQTRTSKRCNIVPHKCLQLLVTSRFIAALERCGHVSSGFAILLTFMEEGCPYVILAQQHPRRSNSCPHKGWAMWKCHACNARSESVQGGQQIVWRM